MADEPKVELETPEETGDEAAASPESTSASGGDSAGSDDAASAADTARDEYLAQLSARVARETVAELMRSNGNSAGQGNQAAPPPTAASGAVVALHEERQRLDAEEARIQRAIEAEGLTAANLYAHQQYAIKDGRWLAKVNLEATRMSEREREVSKKGDDDAWKNFVNTYPPGTDIELLRDAFEKRQERAAAVKPGEKPKPPKFAPRQPDSDRVVVDVSGASEVTAHDRKARTMTSAQIETRKAQLRESDMDAYIKFGKDLRNGAIIRKG